MQRLMRRREVERLCAISSATIYRYIAKGLFPRPVRIGRNSVRWRESDVVRWLEAIDDVLRAARCNIIILRAKRSSVDELAIAH